VVPTEQVTFKEGGVTVTLKITQEQGDARCTLLLDISEGSVLGDPYEFVPPCTVGRGTSAGAAIMDAARGLPDAARVLMAMGEREAGLATLVVSHQIAAYATTRLRQSLTSPA
jgi:hypothetical protein